MGNFGAYLEIPQIQGKIILAPNQFEYHIGKQEIKNAATSGSNLDSSAFNSISSARKDSSGQYLKEQFIITEEYGAYFIQDRGSTNGTYLGSTDLKKSGKVKLGNNTEIVVPIEENGSLVQLRLYFKIATKAISNPTPSAGQYQDPDTYSAPSYKTPVSTPSSSGVQYQDPDTYASPQYNAPSSAQYQDPDAVPDYDSTDSSGSFILVHQKIPIPPNAFRPDSGIDLSMVYKLEKSEFWHIMYAFALLFTMIYHTFINMNLIFLLSGVQPFDAKVFFVDPIPTAFFFGISFIIHEMSHLYTGKHFGFQSRFCLTEVGVKATKKAALIGFPFGLPGAAVSIGVDPDEHKDQMGKIKLAGPTSNLVFGTLLLVVAIVIPLTPTTFQMKSFIFQGASLNFVLGGFNMIPKSVKGFALDGENIIKWNPKIYTIIVICLIAGIVSAVVLTNTLYADYNDLLYQMMLESLPT